MRPSPEALTRDHHLAWTRLAWVLEAPELNRSMEVLRGIHQRVVSFAVSSSNQLTTTLMYG
jgi:hypothetical protein